jgi:hypothetical protein
MRASFSASSSLPRFSSAKPSSPWRGDEASLDQIEFGPVDAVMQNAQPSAWEKLLPFFFGQAEPVRDEINHIGDPLLSLAGKLKYWQH